jgi:hypothetical protein
MYVIYFFDAVSISAGFTKPASIVSEKIMKKIIRKENLSQVVVFNRLFHFPSLLNTIQASEYM